MQVKIVSQTQKIFSSDVAESVLTPTAKGLIEIFPGHYNMVAMLDLGSLEVTVAKEAHKTKIFVSSGFVEVNNDVVTVLADAADLPELLVKEEIEAAIKRAEEQISTSTIQATELIQLEKQLRYERFKLENFENI